MRNNIYILKQCDIKEVFGGEDISTNSWNIGLTELSMIIAFFSAEIFVCVSAYIVGKNLKKHATKPKTD